jgi:hypothetical protein
LAHEHRKCGVFLLLSTLPTAGYVLSAHVHNLAQDVGKGRPLITGTAALISMQMQMQRVWVCAL